MPRTEKLETNVVCKECFIQMPHLKYQQTKEVLKCPKHLVKMDKGEAPADISKFPEMK